MPATEARDAVLNALKLAGVDVANGGRTALPTARTRAVVDRLCDATPEKLREDRVDVKELMRNLLDWHAPRATKSVNRAALAAMIAERSDGASLWPHAVEALSYAAVWAPMLDPDRLGRVLAHATASPTSAYAPIRYAAGPAAALHRTVGHYQPARLEQLATTLWDAAHDGRWWDVCGGLGVGADGGVRRRRRRRARGEELEAEMEARATALRASVTGDIDSIFENLVSGGTAHWTPQAAASLRGVRIDAEKLDAVVEFCAEDHEDPDVPLLCAQLVDLPPTARPANPVPAMIDALEFLLGDESPAETLPKKPTHWGQLYPKGSLNEYPIHGNVLVWDFAELPDSDGAIVELIRTPHALFENRDYMGNCTGGFNDRCQAGTYVLGKVHYNAEIYNWSIMRGQPTEPWRVSEINSRFNRGDVPATVNAGVRAMVERINRGVRPERPAPDTEE